MKKKILALALVLPLVFMLALYSVGKIAGIYVNIAVSGISITTQNADGFIEIDTSEYNDELFIQAQVEPVNATNKKYGYTVSGVNGADAADISVDGDGRLRAKGLGSAKVTVTSAENGFTDSVIVTLFSSRILSLQPKITDIAGNRQEIGGENNIFSTSINSGVYTFSAAAYPASFSSDVIWTSENENILEINSVTGKAKAKLSGKTAVKAVCKSGKGAVGVTINVNVERSETASGITVNGLDSPTLACAKSAAAVSLLIDCASGSTGDIKISGIGAFYVSEKTVTNVSENQYLVELGIKEFHPDEMELEISVGEGKANAVKLNFTDYSFNVYTSYHLSGNTSMYQTRGSEATYIADGEPYDNSITYEWISTEGKLTLDPSPNNSTCAISADKTGSDTLIVNAFRDGKQISSVVKTVTVIKPVSSIEFVDNAKTYGIENMLAVGDSAIKNGKKVPLSPSLSLRIRTDEDDYSGKLSNDFTLASSDYGIVSAFAGTDSIGLDVSSSGVVTLKIEWKYAEYFGADVSAGITLRAVKDGVTVGNYADLMSAAENGYKIVLSDDVMLGRKGAGADELRSYAKTMPTDYDWQFYKNRGLARPEAMYLVEFKNDVYGNGHFINGDYVTKAEDSTGTPLLFKGPLNFVSISSAAVKAQDNIVFLVRTNGVTLDNVVLKGCSDESITSQDGMDLTELNNTGTTLELASDCRILNSRVSNGRTTVRVFGGKTTDGSPVVASASQVNAEEERINVRIESCVLSNAREFILKIGSNRAVRASKDANGNLLSARFKKADGSYYSQFDGSNIDDEYFYQKYVVTDVTLKNSVLTTSGLFSIGMETHFNGAALAGTALNINNWTDLACTSFASALRLEGDVKLLDWKELCNVDSSTLIESTSETYAFLKLDIGAMLTKVSTLKNDYKTIISNIDGKKYVHGGIACFGGGYNYSYVDASACTREAFKKFRINISVLAEGESSSSDLYMQGTMLPVAAGTEDFVFYIYDSESENDYIYQQQQIQNGITVTPAVF